jgi:hypothetical protein
MKPLPVVLGVLLCLMLLHDGAHWLAAVLFGLAVAWLGSGIQKQEDEIASHDRKDRFWDRWW